LPTVHYQETLEIKTGRRGLHEVTARVARAVQVSGVQTGLCNVFICHTSASLTIQENADPSARKDLENFLDRLVPENDPHYTHTAEGSDDMPSHIKSVLSDTSLVIPVLGSQLGLGTWQGIYVWEHRDRPSPRRLILTVQGKQS
jgi:secondary thiamine-phosphate synthase enzyme